MTIRTAVLSFVLAATFAAQACMTFVVGRKLSPTGRVIVGHNEDDWPPYERCARRRASISRRRALS